MSYPIISIIVPVYKVEPYLSQCVDSLINQTYPHLEIILIDDGSPDNCGRICDDYAAKDNRIKVIHQENQGLSAARNTGLSNVSGDYVMFIDGDDWTDITTCETAIGVLLKYQADVVMWSYTREYSSHSVPKIIFHDDIVIFDQSAVVSPLHRRFIGLIGSELSHPENADALCTVWGKLYRREIIQSEFTNLNEIGSYEDGLFNLQVFSNVNTAVFIKKPMYHYRKTNLTSVTSSYNPKLFSQWQHLFDLMGTYIDEHNLPSSYVEALNNRIALSLIGLGLNVVSANISPKAKIHKISNILDTERYRNAYKRLQYQYFPLHWKVFFIFAKLRFSAGVYTLLLAIRRIISK